MANVLIVLTSKGELGATGKPTGFYFDELATPYWTFTDAGHVVAIASIAGGAPKHDPSSLKDDPAARPASVERFLNNVRGMAKLAATPSIDQINPAEFDAIFLPGGHGTMYDFPQSDALSAVVGAIYDAGGAVGAVCHGPAGLVGAKRADGKPLVDGLRVNSFTDEEEAAVGLANVLPFLLESKLRALGGKFERTSKFDAFAVRDGRLTTGQNPASAKAVSLLMLEAIAETEALAPA